MRRMVSTEMLGTIASATSWAASSWQSQKLSDRPCSSGRSRAILTRWSATEGGKDRLAAGSRLVAQARESLVAVSLGPFADVAHAQATGRGGLLQGHASLEQQEEATAPGQTGGGLRRSQPVLDLGPVGGGRDDLQGGFTATHGDTRRSGVQDGDRPSWHS